MGRACDMACPHCSQHCATVGKVEMSDAFVDWLLYWAKISTESRYTHTIMFWGGEPLVYLDGVKKIVDMVSAVNPKIKYTIHTNGKKLNKEICDYLYEHDFLIIMSYDLPNPLIIRSDAADETSIAAFNAYKGNKRIKAIYTAKTPSLHCIYEAGDKLFPNVEISFGSIRDSEGTPDELLAYEDGKIEKDIQNLWEYFTTHPNRKEIYNFFYETGRFVEKREYLKDLFSTMTFPFCGCGYSNIAIDLAGNIYTCQNTYNIVGNVCNSSFNELQDSILRERYAKLPDKCKSCAENYICKSSCLTFKNTENCITQCDFLRKWTANVLNIYNKHIK